MQNWFQSCLKSATNAVTWKSQVQNIPEYRLNSISWSFLLVLLMLVIFMSFMDPKEKQHIWRQMIIV